MSTAYFPLNSTRQYNKEAFDGPIKGCTVGFGSLIEGFMGTNKIPDPDLLHSVLHCCSLKPFFSFSLSLGFLNSAECKLHKLHPETGLKKKKVVSPGIVYEL